MYTDMIKIIQIAGHFRMIYNWVLKVKYFENVTIWSYGFKCLKIHTRHVSFNSKNPHHVLFQ